MGERDLWDVIVNNDDVCFKHILPKLNTTDLKFLHDVNSETRAMIKRAKPFGIELGEAFNIAEMSSISTLEFAWENRSLWPGWWNETSFCDKVALTNKLELLKWAREEKKCVWGQWTIQAAASQSNLEMVKYCATNGCPINMSACARAARNGHLECLKYLHEEAKALWDSRTAEQAAENGHLHILKYLVEREYKYFYPDACRYAARNGHLDCLKFLHETAKAPWNSRAVQDAYFHFELECLQYLVDNNCPLPEGWKFENGRIRMCASSSPSSSSS